MNIFIASDHNGFELKNALTRWLEENGHTVFDLGPDALDQHDDYPDFGFRVAEETVKNREESLGIAICGSGVGMAVAANKVPGVRAAVIHDAAMAQAARNDDDVNVLALGALYITPEQAKEVVRAFLSTPFAREERFVRRIGKISSYEEK